MMDVRKGGIDTLYERLTERREDGRAVSRSSGEVNLQRRTGKSIGAKRDTQHNKTNSEAALITCLACETTTIFDPLPKRL